jgi:spermidine/putrescine transport system ATP-binding protein
MSDGALQQLGTPRDIYEQPHNMFVADFIGDTNLLEVTVEAISGGDAKCRIDDSHTLICTAVDKVVVGARLHLSIRPERMILTDEVNASQSFKGTVVENIFIGTDITTIVKLETGPQITVRTSNSDRGSKRIIDVGHDAFIKIEVGAARLLAD